MSRTTEAEQGWGLKDVYDCGNMKTIGELDMKNFSRWEELLPGQKAIQKNE